MRSFDGGIYQVRNMLTEDRYIGQASDLHRRRKRHWNDLRGGNHHNIRLQRAWAKYGEGAFKFEVLERCATDQLNAREQWYLDHHRPEYNISTFAASPMLGRKRSLEHTEKIRQANAGKKRTPEQCERIAAGKRGKKQSPEQVEKRIAPLRGRPGRQWTQEQKDAMAAQKRGVRPSEATREKMRSHPPMRHTPESRAKISAAHKGRPGRKWTQEQKDAVSAKLKGRPKSPRPTPSEVV